MPSSIWEGWGVRLRAVESSDWEAFHRTDTTDTDSLRMSDMIPFPPSTARSRGWAERASGDPIDEDAFHFAIENTKLELVGIINTHSCSRRAGTFMYGLGIFADHRRRGYASASIALVLHYYFSELRYQKVTIHIYDFNEPCIRLHEALGFQSEGRLRRMVFTAGQHHDVRVFGLTAEEYGGLQVRLAR